ncbi:MAG: hypothetical protein EKK64_08600 [Neisseriaceae bacterium]|nr:MAG: hypothetical protein EKK64_08600 [Neisseriaceae bacterium]
MQNEEVEKKEKIEIQGKSKFEISKSENSEESIELIIDPKKEEKEQTFYNGKLVDAGGCGGLEA